jgi:hypothetical protein
MAPKFVFASTRDAFMTRNRACEKIYDAFGEGLVPFGGDWQSFHIQPSLFAKNETGARRFSDRIIQNAEPTASTEGSRSVSAGSI